MAYGNGAASAAPVGQLRLVFGANDNARVSLPDERIVDLVRYRF